MNRRMLGALSLALLTAGCAETGTNGEFGRVLGEVLGSATTPQSQGTQGTLSIAEIDAGLREALRESTFKQYDTISTEEMMMINLLRWKI